MDPLVTQLSRELTDAIAAAVANDARVTACREKARAAGYDLRLSLDAAIGFAGPAVEKKKAAVKRLPAARQHFEMTATDRRFLKSLRISADEPASKID